MTIRDTFKLSWEDAVIQSALNREIEIFPERKVILRNVHIGKYELAEFIVLFGDTDYPVFVATRFAPDIMLIPAYLRLFVVNKAMKKEGYNCHLTFINGIVQVAYSVPGYASHLR